MIIFRIFKEKSVSQRDNDNDDDNDKDNDHDDDDNATTDDDNTTTDDDNTTTTDDGSRAKQRKQSRQSKQARNEAHTKTLATPRPKQSKKKKLEHAAVLRLPPHARIRTPATRRPEAKNEQPGKPATRRRAYKRGSAVCACGALE